MRTNIEDITCELFINEAGKRMWRFSDGTILPWVGGGDGPEDDPDDDDEEDDDEKDKGKNKPKTFTQAEVNRAARNERKAEALRLAKSLGFETVEAMKAALASKKDSDDKDTKDLDKVKGELSTEKARAEKAESDLEAVRLAAQVFGELIEAGLNPKSARRAQKLIEVDAEADADEIKEAIEALKSDMPELFPASGDDDDEQQDKRRAKPDSSKLPPSSDRPRRKADNKGNSKKTADELLWERHPKTRPNN